MGGEPLSLALLPPPSIPPLTLPLLHLPLFLSPLPTLLCPPVPHLRPHGDLSGLWTFPGTLKVMSWICLGYFNRQQHKCDSWRGGLVSFLVQIPLIKKNYAGTSTDTTDVSKSLITFRRRNLHVPFTLPSNWELGWEQLSKPIKDLIRADRESTKLLRGPGPCG